MLFISLLAEYMLLSSMLRHVYDKYFLFFRNALAVFIGICCVYFILRGTGAVLPSTYTLFAGLPFGTTTIRRNRRGIARTADDPRGKAGPADPNVRFNRADVGKAAYGHYQKEEGIPNEGTVPPGRQMEFDKQAAFLRYAMHADDATGKRRPANRPNRR